MREVTKAVFFAFIGKLNVTPGVRLETLKNREFVSDWLLSGSRKCVGVSVADSHGVQASKFYLAGTNA